MPLQATVFRVLIASPSDANEERKAIAQVIHDWNSEHSEVLRAFFRPLRWEFDSVSEMGAPAQEIVNKQLVDKSDLLIGVFKTKLGTPTKDFDSGTVEEIELTFQAKKPLSIFFQKPSPKTLSDAKELRRVEKYRKSVESRGLNLEYSSIDELRRQVRMVLTKNAHEFRADEPVDQLIDISERQNPSWNDLKPGGSAWKGYRQRLSRVIHDWKSEVGIVQPGPYDKSIPHNLSVEKTQGIRRIINQYESTLLDLVSEDWVSRDETFKREVEARIIPARRLKGFRIQPDGGQAWNSFWSEAGNLLILAEQLVRIGSTRPFPKVRALGGRGYR